VRSSAGTGARAGSDLDLRGATNEAAKARKDVGKHLTGLHTDAKKELRATTTDATKEAKQTHKGQVDEWTRARKTVTDEAKKLHKGTDKELDSNRKDAVDNAKKTRKRYTDEIEGMRGDATDSVKKLHKSVDNQLHGAAKDANRHSTDMKHQVGRNVGDMLSDASSKLRSMAGNFGSRFGEMVSTTRSRGSDMRGSMHETMTSVDSTTYSGLSYLVVQTNKALKSFGAKPVALSIDVPKHRGGGIPNPRASGQDDHLLIDPSGRPVAAMAGDEGIVNTPQMGYLDRMLAKTKAFFGDPFGSLGELWQSGMNHYAKGGQLRRFQGGGLVPIPGPDGGGQLIFAPLLGAVEALMRRFHAHVSAGWAPQGTHAPNSDHHWGGAVDLIPGIGGSWDLIDQLAHIAEPTQNHPAPPFRWVGYTGDPNHGRGNHLHLSWFRGGPFGLPAGLGGAGIALLKKLHVKGPDGSLKTLAQRIVDRVREAGDQKIAKEGAAMGIGGPGGPLGPGAKTVAASWFSGVSGYIGSLIAQNPLPFAELSDPPGSGNWSALGRVFGTGELPAHTRLKIGYRGRSVIGQKLDRGSGGPGIGGHTRAIDLHDDLKRALGFPDLDLVQVERARKGGLLRRLRRGGYVNPIGRGLKRGRTDMGVDYSGAGNIRTIGPAEFTEVNRHWKGAFSSGARVVYRLTAGPAAGRYVFVAEDLTPAPGLKVGQRVGAGFTYAHARGTKKGTGIEMGWADPRTGLALSEVRGTDRAARAEKFKHGTPEGKDFLSFIRSAGHRWDLSTPWGLEAFFPTRPGGTIHPGRTGGAWVPPGAYAGLGSVGEWLGVEHSLKAFGIPRAAYKAIVGKKFASFDDLASAARAPLDAKWSLAQLTGRGNTADDIKVARAYVELDKWLLKVAKRSGEAAAIQSAADQLKSDRETLHGLRYPEQQLLTGAESHTLERLTERQALDQLIDDPTKAQAAGTKDQGDLYKFWLGVLHRLQRHHAPPALITEAAGNVLQYKPPSAAAQASEVLAQVSAFDQSRRELFSSFGSNFASRGTNPFAGPAGRAAGMRYFGALGGAGAPAGPQPQDVSRPNVHIENHYPKAPVDGHTWSNEQRFHVEALFG
jgi:hypothetical protein